MICHASGDTLKRYVVGYYMYHILPQKKDKGEIYCNNIDYLLTMIGSFSYIRIILDKGF